MMESASSESKPTESKPLAVDTVPGLGELGERLVRPLDLRTERRSDGDDLILSTHA